VKKPLTLAFLLTGLCICLSVVMISATGCASMARALNIENPRYSVRNLRPRVDIALPLSASSIDFDFDLGVDNPNDVRLYLDRLDFDLLVDDEHLLTSTSRQGAVIPARGFGEVHLRSRVGYQEIRAIFRQVADLVQGNRGRYQVRGMAYYDTPIGTMRFPVTVYSSR
jgi:LEA14-like dessication related protein